MKSAGWVYILKCGDDSYYTGCTDNLMRIMNEHIRGTYKGYTSKRLPIELVYSKSFDNMIEAMNAEKQVKGWSRRKKEALMKGDFKILHHLSECKNESNYLLKSGHGEK